MFLVSFPRIFKTAARPSLVESLFNKVIEEISAFYKSVENSITCIGVLRKLVLLGISLNFRLTGAAGL